MKAKDLPLSPKRRWARWLWMAASGAAVVAAALGIRYGMSQRQAEADAPREVVPVSTEHAAPSKPAPNTVAIVNGQPLSREALADECLRYHGKEVLVSVTNKCLIMQHCQKRGITITKQEVDREIQQTAKRFGVTTDQWLAMLESERGINADHYRNDIVWPTIALRRLAADQLDVTVEEIEHEFERRYGPKVSIRLISVADRKNADQLRAAAAAAPHDFPRLAVKHSNDVDSASSGGLIPPVRRHAGDPDLEKIAFGLQVGEVSEVIPINNQFLILKCDEHLPGNPPKQEHMKAVEEDIRKTVKDRKLRASGADLFKELQKAAVIRNIMNDPQESQRRPGVAATVNGQPIMLAQLAEECIARHGREVLQRMIMRTIVAQALRRQQVAVSDADVEAEIAHAATKAGALTPERKPDVAGYIADLTQKRQIDEISYRNDIVWPTVALKKIVADSITISEEEMQKGFEAAYGPRVRCRAIVMDNHRRAQEVWDMARRDPSIENFGQLARKYSVEPGSKNLDGEVPPIQMHGNQEALEKEAFALKAGEISGVIQVADKFIVLFCEGRTKQVVTERRDVESILKADLHERKLQVAMGRTLDGLQDAANVENYLDPRASHKPAPKAEGKEGASEKTHGIATRPDQPTAGK